MEKILNITDTIKKETLIENWKLILFQWTDSCILQYIFVTVFWFLLFNIGSMSKLIGSRLYQFLGGFSTIGLFYVSLECNCKK